MLRYPCLALVVACFKMGPARQALLDVAKLQLRHRSVSRASPRPAKVPRVPPWLELTPELLYDILRLSYKRLLQLDLSCWTLNCGRTRGTSSMSWMRRWGTLGAAGSVVPLRAALRSRLASMLAATGAVTACQLRPSGTQWASLVSRSNPRSVIS